MNGADAQAETDEQLLQRYRGGGADADRAFEMLVERYRIDLFRFLLRFTGKKAVTDDLFQESFLQVHLSADSFDTTRKFKPWLFTIAANKARDYLRKNRRQSALSLSASVGRDADSAQFVDLLEADLPLPTDRVLAAEQSQRVRDVVAGLPDHMREVLVMAYFNKQAYKEIAESLSIPLGTVKSRLHAAVAMFAAGWADSNGREDAD